MCQCHQPPDSPSRRLRSAGYFFLFLALLFQTAFEDGFGLRHHTLFNGVRFILFGCAIGLLLWFNRRRCRAASPRP